MVAYLLPVVFTFVSLQKKLCFELREEIKRRKIHKSVALDPMTPRRAFQLPVI
jgi:hypothetical protein